MGDRPCFTMYPEAVQFTFLAAFAYCYDVVTGRILRAVIVEPHGYKCKYNNNNEFIN